MKPTITIALRAVWLCLLGLAVCLGGCQPKAQQAAPVAPPPLPPAAAPRPVRPTVYVAINQLNLRSCPGKDCPKIYALELNTEVEKMSESGDWTQIRVKKDGTMGWVSSRYLSPKRLEAAASAKKKRRDKHSLASKHPKAESESEAPPKKETSPAKPEGKPGFQIM